MTSKTERETAPHAGTAYVIEVPNVATEAARLFLRRSQEAASSPIALAVAEYQSRVQSGESYGDAMSVKEFRNRYLS